MQSSRRILFQDFDVSREGRITVLCWGSDATRPHEERLVYEGDGIFGKEVRSGCIRSSTMVDSKNMDCYGSRELMRKGDTRHCLRHLRVAPTSRYDFLRTKSFDGICRPLLTTTKRLLRIQPLGSFELFGRSWYGTAY